MAAKVKKKQLRWPKEAIREEIQRLDRITGLNGAAVTIRLYQEREPMGCFTFIDPVRMTFGFSTTRFEEPGFTQAEALDIVRHEYAHFMEYRLFGKSTDHGPNWKQCCLKIGARPEALYTERWKEEAREKERELARKNRVDGFTIGKTVHHPEFGEGTVEQIDRLPTMTILSVRFSSGIRKLDVAWVRSHCSV